jgi:RES domain-containing protein
MWGGRWNRPGIPLIYAAETASLAILEQLVQTRVETSSLAIVAIDIPDDVEVQKITQKGLPRDWRRPDHALCAEIGSQWAESRRTFVLRAPSAVNELEDIIVLNPRHEAVARCRVGKSIPVRFDRRLVTLVQRAAR